MSAVGSIRHNNTEIRWDEYKNEIQITPAQITHKPEQISFIVKYEGARELLDCLMAIFDRTEIQYQYPETKLNRR